MSEFDDLPFTLFELQKSMSETYDELLDLFFSENFQNVWEHMKKQNGIARFNFISQTILDREVLKRDWSVIVPDQILIERSSFGDRRPTLFCLKKYLPEKFHQVWENVNLTFDEEYEMHSIPTTSDVAWREPLIPGVQSLLLAAGLPLEEIPDDFKQPMH